MERFFFVTHPLEIPDFPGRWPFFARYTEIGSEGERVFQEGFVNLDSVGPGLLNTNMDPCVFSEPLPWFLAHCRIDSIKKRHNRVLLLSGKQGGLLSQEVACGDVIFFGGFLGKNIGAEECLLCNISCSSLFLWIDTIFIVKDKLEMPLKEVNPGVFEHTIGTEEGFALFREAAKKKGISTENELSAFKETPAWRFNLSDCEHNHRYVDYSPYYILISEPGKSFIPIRKSHHFGCPLLKKRKGLFFIGLEELEFKMPSLLSAFLNDNGVRVAQLDPFEGETFLDICIRKADKKINHLDRLFFFKPGRIDPYRIRLSEVLRSLGYSQREVASWGELQFVTLNKIARGEVPPTVQTLARISSCIGCEIKTLIEETDGPSRSLFHQIASCPNILKAKRAPGSKNPCAKIDSLKGEKSLEDITAPVPWYGSLRGASMVFVGMWPDQVGKKDMPTFSKAWFPGKVESFFKWGGAENSNVILDKTVTWALTSAQLFLTPQNNQLSNVSVTYLCHCSGNADGASDAFRACLDRFGRDLVKHAKKLLITSPDGTGKIMDLIGENALFEGNGAKLLMLPSKNDVPVLEVPDLTSPDIYTSILAASKQCPRIALLPASNDLESLPEAWIDALKYYVSGRGMEKWAPFALDPDNRRLWCQALFNKIVLCPEIRRYLEGDRINPCEELFFSYYAGNLDDIYIPLPWAGDIGKAKVLFVGFKPPFKKEGHPHYGDSYSLSDVNANFQTLPYSRNAPFSQIRTLLAQYLEVSPNLLNSYMGEALFAYTPVIHCMNRLKEGSFPVGILETCCQRYLQAKLMLSGANIIFVLGKKACVYVMKSLCISYPLNRTMIYEYSSFKKLFVFLPSVKKGINSLLPEERDVFYRCLNPVRDIVRKSILKKATQPKRKL